MKQLLAKGLFTALLLWTLALPAAPPPAQLQTSGGRAIISQGGNDALVSSAGALSTNLAQVNGAAIALGQTTMANSLPVAIASNQSALPVTISAGSNVVGKVVPATACGTTVASQALAAVPISSTAVFASTTCVITIVLNNTTSGALTVSVSDNQGTPVNDVLTFSIPPFSQMIQPLSGVQFTGGVKWSASGSGVTGAILGYQ